MSTRTVHAGSTTRGDVGGRSVVLAYGSVAAEYEALHSRAALFDRSHRGRIRVSGERAAEMVAGLVSNDVAALAPGQGCYAAALTAKGKIVADVRVFVEESSVLVDAPARAADGWAAMVKKFVNPRVAPHADESARLRDIGIFGANSRHIVATVTGIQSPALTALAPYAHVTVEIDGARVLVASVPDLGLEGFELLVPTEAYEALWRRAVDAGATRSRRRRTSTSCTPSRTRRAATSGRRRWRGCTSAGTSTSTFAACAPPAWSHHRAGRRCTMPPAPRSATSAPRCAHPCSAASRWR